MSVKPYGFEARRWYLQSEVEAPLVRVWSFDPRQPFVDECMGYELMPSEYWMIKDDDVTPEPPRLPAISVDR